MFTFGRRGFLAGLMLFPAIQRLTGTAPAIREVPMADRGLCPDCATTLSRIAQEPGKGVNPYDGLCGRCWPQARLELPAGFRSDPEMIDAIRGDIALAPERYAEDRARMEMYAKKGMTLVSSEIA